MKIVNLISGPRNLSTAIMYAFAQRDDFVVMDEPYYGYYLTNATLEVLHPSQSEIIATLQHKESQVTKMIKQTASTSNLFVKGMAHHYLVDEPDYILDWENVILIRHPKKLLASFSKVIENPSIDDIGIKKAAALFSFLKQQDKTPIVIDSDELLKNPGEYLNLLCLALKIPFQKNMLKWEKGGIPEDGIWANHWYKNVHNSTGFKVQKTSSQPMPKHLENVLEEAMTYYNTLKNHVLKN